MAANSDEILHDLSPSVRVYKDGRIERLSGEDFIPASLDPGTGVQSKDVVIAPEIDLSARLFLPGNARRSGKLPLVVYFHGGGFYYESAFSPLYHKHLNCLVAEAKVVAVSVSYRLAPEHPLPIAFDDSWRALKWVASRYQENDNDDWIKEYGDQERVYVGGDSAGGTIAHNMAMRVGSEKLDGINLRGVFLNCPFFYGKDPIGNEDTDGRIHLHWRIMCPGTTGSDDPQINPAMDPKLSTFGCKRLLVYVAEKDGFRARGWYYKEALSESGWDGEIEVVDVEGEEHDFSVLAPDGDSGIAMLQKVASFLNYQ